MWSKERDLVFQAPGFSHSANSWSAAAPPKPQPRPGGLVGGLWVGEEGLGHHRPCPPGSHPSPTPHPGRTTIWDHRVRFLEEQALPHWPHVPFTGQHPAGQMSQNPPHSGQAVKAVSACALPARHSPGHHEELVNLLVHERVAGLPHLGLQLGLVSAILLACGEGVPWGKAAGAAGGAPRL